MLVLINYYYCDYCWYARNIKKLPYGTFGKDKTEVIMMMRPLGFTE